MNYYIRSDSEGGHYTGGKDGFKNSWKAVSDAVEGNDMIKMFWSPNGWPEDWRDWFPSSGKVDVVGLDHYPNKPETFKEVYQPFCQEYKSLPFVIGETGAGPSLKQNWWNELVSPAAKEACPNYLGFSWFEYNKEEDFRVATNGQSVARDSFASQRRARREARRVRYA